jgi:tetratricopeptide (TPR) repeat protein
MHSASRVSISTLRRPQALLIELPANLLPKHRGLRRRCLHPHDPLALWFLGFVLIAEGKSVDAIPVLEKAVSLSHGSPGARGVLVRAYANAGRRKDALRVFEGLRRQRQTEYVPAGALVQAYIGYRVGLSLLAALAFTASGIALTLRTSARP